jgi:hypothetical protein
MSEGKTKVFLSPETIQIVAKGAKQAGMDPEAFANKALEDYINDLKAKEEAEKSPIEYEEVSIKLPKLVLQYLRGTAIMQGRSAEEETALEVIDMVRSDMEGMNGEDWIETLGLGSIFYQLLKDERFKPK